MDNKKLYKEMAYTLDKLSMDPMNLSILKRNIAKLLIKYETLLETYIKLQRKAMIKETIRYADLAEMFNLKREGSWMGKFLGKVLGILNTWEFIHNRPMISVIVVRSDTGKKGKNGKPGKGFIEFAKVLGRYDDTIEKENDFIKSERASVFKTWG